MKKGDITIKVLELIVSGTILSVIGLVNALIAISASNYGSSYKRMTSSIYNNGPFENNNQKIKQRYRNIIYKLKKDGLIREEVKNNKKVFILTGLGKNKLTDLKKRQKEQLPSIKSFKKEKGDRFIIVIFDIPEKERRKRNWLREVLKNIGLEMIQKSVWIGKVKIPKELINELNDFKIINFVEIFEITKGGSLKSIS
jgi:hypothetical protein